MSNRGLRRRSFPRDVSCMIQLDGQGYCLDPVGGVLGVLGQSWTLPLIGVLGNRPASRFNEIQDAVEGIGSKVLAKRLRELGKLGLVTRSVFPEVPVRVEYRLTESGTRMRKALIPLLQWASTRTSPALAASSPLHLPAERNAPTRGS